MKKFIKRRVVLFSLFLLLATHHVYAAKWVNEPFVQMQQADYAGVPAPKRNLLVHGYCKAYHIPSDLCFFIRCLVYDNPFKYRNKTLPNDLSRQDLSGFDFTGCAFTHTNLTDVNLTNVILAGTTCSYQKAFQDNIKENKIEGGKWYQETLLNDLKSIAEVYPKLNNDAHKAKLLCIACGLSRLPFYEEVEFHIQVEYWSCGLLRLKQVLSKPYGGQLTCSLAWILNHDVDKFLWKTDYPQNKVNIRNKPCHANFAKYLDDFYHGLLQYKCKSKDVWRFNWYKEQITENIKGLQKAYPNIKDKQLQQGACNIADALSKSYQVGQWLLLHHYLFYQHRLMRLKNSVGVQVKNDIYYNRSIVEL